MSQPCDTRQDAEPVIEDILSCYARLLEHPDLNPSPAVNALFTELVHLCSQVLDDAMIAEVLEDPRVSHVTPRLRELCSNAEYKLESHWTNEILSHQSHEKANKRLREFTYYHNYVDLVRMELNALHTVAPTKSLRKFAVLGSGPLPLTALCISDALQHNDGGPVCIHNVDQDSPAIAKSSKLCHALGHSKDTMCFHCADAQAEALDLHQFDVVYLAALVGRSHDEKEKIVGSVVRRMRSQALLVIRTAHSLRGLMYPVIKISEAMCSTGLRPLLIMHPYNHVINSVIIGRVEPNRSLPRL